MSAGVFSRRVVFCAVCAGTVLFAFPGQTSTRPVTPPVTAVSISDGDDWSLPAWVTPASDYVFYSEDASPAFHINTHVIDVTWRQLNPSPGVYTQNLTDSWNEVGSGEAFNFGTFADQRSWPGHYWLRVWMSGEQWAPAWVLSDCGIPASQRWLDHSQQDRHIPLWNPCVWNHAKNLYRTVLQDWGVRNDPRFELAYVPGGFYYTEFDFDVMWAAFQDGVTSTGALLAWLADMRQSLVAIADGENNDPNDDYHHKLMYTGQDYPFDFIGTGFGAFELHARDATTAGMGVRSGITELFNFHLNETPAYGSHIQPDGHVTIDENAPVHQNNHVIGNENECYNSCGFSTNDPYYAVVMSNLKALQLRTNHLYVAPDDSYMADYPAHWDWVEKELGKKAHNAPDAWVALREYEDRFWVNDQPENDISWNGKPWLHNFERWLVQKDIAPDGQSRRGSELRQNVLGVDNGTSYEGRRTDLAAGQNALYFFVQDNFAFGPVASLQLKVTYLDNNNASWQLEYRNHNGQLVSHGVTNSNSGGKKTATFSLLDPLFDNGLTGGADFRLFNNGPQDIDVQFVRLIWQTDPIIFAHGFEP